MTKFFDSGDGLKITPSWQPPRPLPKGRDRIAFDRKSQRRFDANGFLHVTMSPISKETVNEYYGGEIPNWDELGLDPNRIYKGYRPGVELAKGAATFNGLNILSEHIKDDAEDPPKGYIIGSMGTDANYSAPYLKNSLIIKDAEAIELLNPADPNKSPKREISASYRYDPVFEAGTFNNVRYDFVMTNIRGNHIALVEEGRAGSDVVVSDKNTINKERGFKMANPLQIIEDLIASLKGAGVVPHEGGEEEAAAIMSGDEDKPAACDEDKPEGANDDALEAALTELFALADSVADEELAAKLKEVGESIRATMGGADDEEEEVKTEEKVVEDEETVEVKTEEKEKGSPAMDKKPGARKKFVAKRGGNTYNINVPLANDAAIAKQVEAKINAKVRAARDVRPLIGEVDPLAFDSAAGIYRSALKAHGIDAGKVSDVTALRQMVQLAQSAKPKESYPVVSALANDSKGKDDPNFAGLGRIRKA